MKEIVIDISNEGEVKIETRGYQGKSCVEEAEFLKAVLGKEICRQLTSAYYNRGKTETKKYLNLCG